jgi:ADP-heptose:LPS heptosyltransferase
MLTVLWSCTDGVSLGGCSGNFTTTITQVENIMLPCGHNKEIIRGGFPFKEGECRICWLYYNDQSYRNQWQDNMKILCHFYQSPGDSLVASAALASLKLLRPDIEIGVTGIGAELYENSHYITHGITEANADKIVKMENNLIHLSHYPHNTFMLSYCMTLTKAVNFWVELKYDRPQISLSLEEKSWMPRIQEITNMDNQYYWVVCQPGARNDYTVKRYPSKSLQEVVSSICDVKWIQVGESVHNHPPLDGCFNEIGKTDLRQLARMVGHPLCQGVLTGESLLWHLAAAFHKPAVCIASGWLPPSWVWYSTGTFLSRHGCLPCCKSSSCWKARTVPLNDGDEKDQNLCLLPVLVHGEYVPKCMQMITPQEIIRAIRNYIDGGVSSTIKYKMF